jgi:hypothetical protein
MEPPNAFIGRTMQPTAAEIASALGPSEPLWRNLITWLATEKNVKEQDWSSVSPKYGWALRLKLKKRTIIYLGPCEDCFRASFVLGARAVTAAHEANLPKPIIQAIDEAPRYAEGTGVRLIVRKEKDLAAIQQLATIKLEN